MFISRRNRAELNHTTIIFLRPPPFLSLTHNVMWDGEDSIAKNKK
jgi:hypothetical protein